MKYLFFLLLIPVISLPAKSQSARVYAYVRETMPGVNPKTISGENGRDVQPEMEKKANYLIYLESRSPLKVTAVWVNGKQYDFTQQEVKNTPVVTGDGPEKRVL